MNDVKIRPAKPAEPERVKEIAVAAEMFTAEEVGFFDEMAGGFFDGSAEGDQWLVADSAGSIQAAAYYAPEPYSDRVWNLYFIAVDPAHRGRGLGAALMVYAENQLRDLGPDQARTLIVETSSTDQYARTRQFYPKVGYVEEARIRDFYGPGDDKVIFWKSLAAET